LLVILSGWKEIAHYLDCGVRTAQRWEAEGLPVKRPTARRNHRGPVLAESEAIDAWVSDSALRHGESGALAAVQRSRDLRRKVRMERENLHGKMEVLRKEVRTFREPDPSNTSVLIKKSDINLTELGFLRAELAVCLSHTKIARGAKRRDAIEQNRTNARKAYDAVLRFMPKVTLTPADETEIKTKLAELRSKLKLLGEDV
jgi:hypothetical protein